MTIGGDYESPEKQFVRAHLWDASIRDLLKHHGVTGETLRVLELPGAKCIYLKHLAEEFGLAKDNIVAVEQYEEAFLAIHAYLGGRGTAFHGAIEDMLESNELDDYFPFDFVNLDFCGQGFVFPDLDGKDPNDREYQRRWDCIKETISKNRAKEKKAWYLMLTLACNRNNTAGKNYLLSQLAEIMHSTGSTKDASTWKEDRLIQEVVPKIVADEALQYDYHPIPDGFDSYRYIQAGHKFRMVAFRFKFVLDTKKQLGKRTSERKRILDNFCESYFSSDGKEIS